MNEADNVTPEPQSVSLRTDETPTDVNDALTNALDEAKGHDKQQLDQSTTVFMHTYSFLFLGYSRSYYFWEVVVMSRKGLLALIGVVLAFDQRAQVIHDKKNIFNFIILIIISIP